MTSVVTRASAGDFDNFYEAHFGDTVAMTYGFTADLGEAQDIAQEAFCRAWLRWREVSTYDNPVAWVRRVATNLAHSRWRRVRVAAAHLVRQREPEPEPAVNPDHVAVVAALRKLPAAQRRAVVLHHLMDLPVNEVAEQLEVPVGTVKSWLHRARAALAHDLRVDVRGAVRTPPAQEVLDRAGRRQRARIATAASAMVLVILGGLAGMRFMHRDDAPPEILSSPTPVLPTPSASDPMESVDWSNASINLSNLRPSCPAGKVSFTTVDGDLVTGPVTSWPRASYQPSRVSLGDLTGDGRAEAALTVTCQLSKDSDDMVPFLLIVQNVDGELVGMATLGRPASIIAATWIFDGVLYVDQRPHPSSQTWQYEFGSVPGWRWEGSKLVPVDGTVYPVVTRLDVSAVEQQLGCPVKVAPSGSPQLIAKDGTRFEWDVKDPAQPMFAEFGRAGQPYMVLRVACGGTVSVVVFDRTSDQWKAIAAMTQQGRNSFQALEVTQRGIREGTVDYEINGDKLVVAGTPSGLNPSGGSKASPS